MSLPLLETILASQSPLALCTVMQVRGSAPRHPGRTRVEPVPR